MDEEFVPNMTLPGPVEDAGEMPTAENPLIETASSEYLGRWNRLVSTTNWEKGRIVAEWREALIEAARRGGRLQRRGLEPAGGQRHAPAYGPLATGLPAVCSDAGSVPGLYWSHFQAALDWDDAEMWLEGAVQNRWSISQMQGERSRTLGALVEESVEAAAVEVDEDAAGAVGRSAAPASSASTAEGDETADAARLLARVFAAGDSVPFDGGRFLQRRRADRRSGRSRICPPCRPIFATPSTASSWRSSTIGFPTGRKSAWRTFWPRLEALRQLALAPAEA